MKKEFLTHSYELTQIKGYVKAYFIINSDIYWEMQAATLVTSGSHFDHWRLDGLLNVIGVPSNVWNIPMPSTNNRFENERYLIRRFILCILSEPNENIATFKNENEYKIFCEKNSLVFKSQEWFKVAFIRGNIDYAESYFLRNSLSFQSLYFPTEDTCKSSILNLKDIQKIKNVKFKNDFDESFDVLKKNEVGKLYHFTEIKNLKSILKNGGLFSNEYCENQGIHVSAYASSETSRKSDKSKGYGNYVRLSFTNAHPMMHYAMNEGRIKNPVIIEIEPTVALLPGALFSNKNAISSDAIIGETVQYLNKIRFDIVRRNNHFQLEESEKPYYQAEILIKERVGCEMFLNLKSLEMKIKE